MGQLRWGATKLKLDLLFSTEKQHNQFIYSWIENYPSNFLKTVAVTSVPPFFEPKARRKEYGGLEATATPAEVSFRTIRRSRGRGQPLAQRRVNACLGRSR